MDRMYSFGCNFLVRFITRSVVEKIILFSICGRRSERIEVKMFLHNRDKQQFIPTFTFYIHCDVF